MSKPKKTAQKKSAEAKKYLKTTVVFAIGTFVGLSLITYVAWAVTRPASDAPSVAAASVVAGSGEHDHEHDFERISIADAKAAFDRGEITLIDVRTVEQFAASHIPGSLQIPLPRIEGEIPYLPKDKLVVTYCSCPAEESSGHAAMILERGGLEAKALHQGFQEWTRLGYPTESGVK